VVWKYVWKPDKNRKDGSGMKGDWDKPPFNAHTRGLASSTDRRTWASFKKAFRTYKAGGWDGIGIVLTDDLGIVGIDLDHCRDKQTGKLKRWARDVIKSVGSYTEISPSGRGIRILARGRKPPGRCRKGPFEVYTTGRYLTMTGHHAAGTPTRLLRRPRAVADVCTRMFGENGATERPRDPRPSLPAPSANGTAHEDGTGRSHGLSDEEIINRAGAAKNGKKFKRLWSGDTASYTSHSEADLALSSILAFWTGPEPDRIDRLFRRSGLRRDKWDREDYRRGVISKALEGMTEYYAPQRDERDGDAGGEAGGKRSQATDLVCLALASGVELFHTPGGYDSEGYATIDVNGHRETWPANSKGFRRWLSKVYYDKCGKAPGSQALQDALNVIAGKAIHEGAEYPVAVRLAEHGGDIWLDLADPLWRAVRVSAEGWSLADSCPVRFVRRRGMLALPEPVRGGRVEKLRPLLNLPGDDAWVLFVAWLVAALRPGRPFPVLAVNGEQGSAKSTLCRIARGLIDPNEAPLRRPPRDDRDLMIAATNGWVVGFDNLSGVRPDLSDALCCLATGGGLGTRQLYTDDEERLFSAKRPVLLNGIEDIATRPDLLDRSVTLTLPAIPDERRQDEDGLWRRYEKVRPRVLGALLDAVAAGLRDLPGVRLDGLPRMADFAKWAVACEPALGLPRGAFLAAYTGNRRAANEAALESSPVVKYLLQILDEDLMSRWQGTVGELLEQLNTRATEGEKQLREWPHGPRGLSGTLRRYAPNLRRAGFDVDFTGQWTRKGKILRIEKLRNPPLQPLKPLQAPDSPEDLQGLAQRSQTVTGQPLHRKCLKNGTSNGRNDRNGQKQAQNQRHGKQERGEREGMVSG
jgi:hypothetical protein